MRIARRRFPIIAKDIKPPFIKILNPISTVGCTPMPVTAVHLRAIERKLFWLNLSIATPLAVEENE